MSWDIESFRVKIENEHNFPGIYMFKFIVPLEKKEQIIALLPKGNISFRNSSANTYVSVTCKARVQTSQDVLDIYIEANKIDGCIAL